MIQCHNLSWSSMVGIKGKKETVLFVVKKKKEMEYKNGT